MYKTETHLHVAEISPCSKIKAEEMMKLYHKEGYSTVFISDHFTPAFSEALGDIPWKDKVTIFLSGFYKAKEAGKKLGLNVLMSAEISFKDTHNHYLVYGITKEFLDSYPDLFKKTPDEFFETANKHNIFVVQAHPFRDDKCFPTPECVHAIEIYNSNPRHDDFNEKAEEFAKANKLYASAGSDAHRLEDIGKSGILSEKEIKSAEDFITLIKKKKAKIFKG